MLGNVLSNVVPHFLTRHTAISCHVEGVPDPLYGPCYAGKQLSPSDDAETAVAAYLDISRVPCAQLREASLTPTWLPMWQQ